MANAPQKTSGVIGAIFLVVAVIQLLQGGSWVVWAILGVLFGGLTFFKRKTSAGESNG
jgi:hypothetical protein